MDSTVGCSDPHRCANTLADVSRCASSSSLFLCSTYVKGEGNIRNDLILIGNNTCSKRCNSLYNCISREVLLWSLCHSLNMFNFGSLYWGNGEGQESRNLWNALIINGIIVSPYSRMVQSCSNSAICPSMTRKLSISCLSTVSLKETPIARRPVQSGYLLANILWWNRYVPDLSSWWLRSSFSLPFPCSSSSSSSSTSWCLGLGLGPACTMIRWWTGHPAHCLLSCGAPWDEQGGRCIKR